MKIKREVIQVVCDNCGVDINQYTTKICNICGREFCEECIGDGLAYDSKICKKCKVKYRKEISTINKPYRIKDKDIARRWDSIDREQDSLEKEYIKQLKSIGIKINDLRGIK